MTLPDYTSTFVAPNAAPPVRVQIPTDTPRWPDVEKALVTVLDDFMTELKPGGYACIIPPENFAELIHNGYPVVTVQRAGGAADRVVDNPVVYISVNTAYRSDSWDVLGWLRPKLHDFSGVVTNPDGSQALVSGIEDMRGPQLDPAFTKDTNRVSAGFIVKTRLDR